MGDSLLSTQVTQTWTEVTVMPYAWGQVVWKISSMQTQVMFHTSGLNFSPFRITRFSRQLVPDRASCSLSARGKEFPLVQQEPSSPYAVAPPPREYGEKKHFMQAQHQVYSLPVGRKPLFFHGYRITAIMPLTWSPFKVLKKPWKLILTSFCKVIGPVDSV